MNYVTFIIAASSAIRLAFANVVKCIWRNQWHLCLIEPWIEMGVQYYKFSCRATARLVKRIKSFIPFAQNSAQTQSDYVASSLG
jgi:hypothetical protein